MPDGMHRRGGGPINLRFGATRAIILNPVSGSDTQLANLDTFLYPRADSLDSTTLRNRCPLRSIVCLRTTLGLAFQYRDRLG